MERPVALALKPMSESSRFITGAGALTESGGMWPSLGAQSSSCCLPCTCSGATSKDLEVLSREPCAHACVGGSCLNRGLSKGMGLGCRENVQKRADQGGKYFCSIGLRVRGRGTLGPGRRFQCGLRPGHASTPTNLGQSCLKSCSFSLPLCPLATCHH